MKRSSINPFLLTQLLAAACITSSAFAAIATKTGTGTNLTIGASWTGGSGPNYPTSDDIATWDTTSLGAGLIANSDVYWGSIAVTGAQTNINISGTGLISTADITLSGSQTLAIANEMDLSASSIYNIADVTGTPAADATISGGISGQPLLSLTKSGTGTLVLSGVN